MEAKSLTICITHVGLGTSLEQRLVGLAFRVGDIVLLNFNVQVPTSHLLGLRHDGPVYDSRLIKLRSFTHDSLNSITIAYLRESGGPFRSLQDHMARKYDFTPA